MLMKTGVWRGKVAPRFWLGGLMAAWNLCTIGLAVTESFEGVLVCRFLMGMLESGFVPGGSYLISRYYKRSDFSIRYALFFGSAVLANAFGGVSCKSRMSDLGMLTDDLKQFLDFLLSKMKGVGGYAGWRWIFLIEGLMTALVAVFGMVFIPGSPEESTFLTG